MTFVNEYDMNQLIKTNLIMSFLSLFGSLCIILLYIFNKNLRSFVFSLVFCLAISEFANSIGNIMSFNQLEKENDTDDKLCTIQGIIIIYTDICSLIWIFFISYTIYDLIKNFNHEVEKKRVVFICLGFSLPVVYTVVSLVIESFSDPGEIHLKRCWCYIRDMDNNHALLFLLYGSYWLIIIFNFIVIVLVIRFMKKNCSENEVYSWKIRKVINKLYNYPIIASLCYIFATIHRMYQVFYFKNPLVQTNEDHRLEFLFYLFHGLFMCLRGFCYFVVYGCDEKVQKQLKYLVNKAVYKLLRQKIYKLNDSTEE